MQTRVFASPRRDRARVVDKSSALKQRAWGMPGARCTRGRACSVESTRVSHHGRTGITRHSRTRMVLTVSFVLSPVIGFLVTVIGVMRSIIANLTPASRRQDHTTSPSAKSLTTKAARRFWYRSRRSFYRRPISAARLAPPPRPPHPVPTSVTIAKRPSQWDGMAGDMQVIWGKREGKYFLAEDWTGSISLIRFRKLEFRRRGCKISFAQRWSLLTAARQLP